MLESNNRGDKQNAADNDACIGNVERGPTLEPENAEELNIREVYHALRPYETVHKVSNPTAYYA